MDGFSRLGRQAGLSARVRAPIVAGVEANLTELPVFELPLAALPTERVPLHIFEERYKRMVAHCRDSGSEFGIVLRTDSGPRSTGCAAAIDEVLEEFDDGRLNVVATGSWRFRVHERYEGESFPLATVESRTDEATAAADPSAAQASFRRLLAAVNPEAGAPEDLDSAYEIACRVEIPVEAKQALLETDSEPQRLRLLVRTLDRLTEQVERSREIAERAIGNGHAPS
jgi:Lon protease-like protein